MVKEIPNSTPSGIVSEDGRSDIPEMETGENKVFVGEPFNGNDGSIWQAVIVDKGEGPEGFFNGIPVRFEKVSDDKF